MPTDEETLQGWKARAVLAESDLRDVRELELPALKGKVS